MVCTNKHVLLTINSEKFYVNKTENSIFEFLNFCFLKSKKMEKKVKSSSCSHTIK